MKNLLRLHEAIVVVLIKQPKRVASIDAIAKEIEKRRLFDNRKGNIPLSKQIELRTFQSKGRYKHLFESTDKTWIKLRNV
jgi:hypothetical protein